MNQLRLIRSGAFWFAECDEDTERLKALTGHLSLNEREHEQALFDLALQGIELVDATPVFDVGAARLVTMRSPKNGLKDWWYVAHLSARTPGKVQLTCMHKGEPWSHTDHETMQEAVESACRGSSYRPERTIE